MKDLLIHDPTAPDAARCALACRLWQLQFSALNLITYREKGAAELGHLWRGLLGASSQSQFLRGLEKLGIDSSGPPAVVAGKYHFFTNLIGGLHMQYIEESQSRVWNRNLGPMWAFPGLSMLSIPSTIRREIMGIWHPNDGALLGSARLGWVITKTMTEGHPYDEGYFFEYPYDLRTDERVRYEVAGRTPECIVSEQPKLDAILWPQARVLKARRRYVGSYFKAAFESLVARHGETVAQYLLAQSQRCLAVQFTGALMKSQAIEGSGAAAYGAFVSSLLTACEQDHEIVTSTSSHIRMHVSPHLQPFDDELREETRRSHFEFFTTAARVINGRLSVTRQPAGKTPFEIWDIRDTDVWQW
ncbi:hypothetical protein [Paraburkholderia sp.]|uniref:hypothetical protein n=1 Tax=Paraburkholderia sp. TaxID=1926495 RepID=UPI0039E2BDAD